jgi:hypothetical protein
MPTVMVRPPWRVRAARGPRLRSEPGAVSDAAFEPGLVAGAPSGVGRMVVMVA